MGNMPIVDSRKNGINPWPLRIISIFWGVMIPFAGILAIPSLMSISAGISLSSTKLADTIFIISTFTLPFVLIISCIAGLVISFMRDNYINPWIGRIIGLLPLINIILFFVSLFI